MLEIMIVLAIIGASMVLLRSGFRRVTKADMVENATELAAVMRRTAQLAVERGEVHRVLFDLEKQLYIVEVCQGQAAIVRNKQVELTEEETKEAIERGKQRLTQVPDDSFAAGDPEEATRKAIAIAGHHVADRVCVPAEGKSGDSTGKSFHRALMASKGIKFKQMWVQHRDTAVSSGTESIYFFPMGSAEKAVIELTDGSDIFTVVVHGLTGRIELRDGELRSVDDHMMRNAMGDREAERETDR